MADEISFTAKLAVTKGNYTFTRTRSDTPDLNTTLLLEAGGVVSVPTTAAGTALGVTGLTTPGWGIFVNVDATNYIEVGTQTGGTTFHPFAKLMPGDGMVCRLGTTAPFARSNTGAALLEYKIFED